MSKITLAFEIEQAQLDWLNAMAQKHGLDDAAKALRVLLDYAKVDGDGAQIFEVIRCAHCD